LGGALAGVLWYFVFVDWNDNEICKNEEIKYTIKTLEVNLSNRSHPENE